MDRLTNEAMLLTPIICSRQLRVSRDGLYDAVS